MSVLIKSDNAYVGTGTIPPISQTLTTPQAVIDAYVARVVADGGEIVSRVAIINAVNFMFQNNIYGKTEVCASPLYGRKLDVDGGILKLYSIYGDDLVGVPLNGGTLPKLVGNFVNFNDGASADDTGGILSTATAKTHSETRSLAIAIAAKNIVNTAEAQAAGFTVHDSGVVANYAIFGFAASPITEGTIVGIVSKNYSTSLSRTTFPRVSQGRAVLVSHNKLTSEQKLYYNGAVGISYSNIIADTRVYNNAHYIDFGGTWRSTDKVVSGIQMSAMWFLKNTNDAQNLAVNAFMQSEYY